MTLYRFAYALVILVGILIILLAWTAIPTAGSRACAANGPDFPR